MGAKELPDTWRVNIHDEATRNAVTWWKRKGGKEMCGVNGKKERLMGRVAKETGGYNTSAKGGHEWTDHE